MEMTATFLPTRTPSEQSAELSMVDVAQAVECADVANVFGVTFRIVFAFGDQLGADYLVRFHDENTLIAYFCGDS